jgi:hypothetical protein
MGNLASRFCLRATRPAAPPVTTAPTPASGDLALASSSPAHRTDQPGSTAQAAAAGASRETPRQALLVASYLSQRKAEADKAAQNMNPASAGAAAGSASAATAAPTHGAGPSRLSSAATEGAATDPAIHAELASIQREFEEFLMGKNIYFGGDKKSSLIDKFETFIQNNEIASAAVKHFVAQNKEVKPSMGANFRKAEILIQEHEKRAAESKREKRIADSARSTSEDIVQGMFGSDSDSDNGAMAQSGLGFFAPFSDLSKALVTAASISRVLPDPDELAASAYSAAYANVENGDEEAAASVKNIRLEPTKHELMLDSLTSYPSHSMIGFEADFDDYHEQKSFHRILNDFIDTENGLSQALNAFDEHEWKIKSLENYARANEIVTQLAVNDNPELLKAARICIGKCQKGFGGVIPTAEKLYEGACETHRAMSESSKTVVNKRDEYGFDSETTTTVNLKFQIDPS